MTRSLVLAFADVDGLLLIAPLLDGNEAFLLTSFENITNSLLQIREMGLSGEGKIFLHLTFGGHEGKNTITIAIDADILSLLDDGGGDHITSAEGFFVLLVSEDVLSGNHGLGGAVLSGLGSGEGSDLAGELFLHHEEGTGLAATSFDKLDVSGTGITLFKLVIRHGF